MEGDNDETHEDVDHEEGDDNDVDKVEYGHNRPVVVDGSNVFSVGINGDVKDAWPAFKGRDDKQGEHGLGHVVIVKGVALPDPLLDNRVVEITVLVDDKLALTGVFSHLRLVSAHEELALEQLHSDDGEHEDQQQGDQHNVADSLDGHNDTLDDMFETLGTVDGTEGAEDTEYTEDFHHRNSTGAESIVLTKLVEDTV